MSERWLALGDSITWGFPVGPSIAWPRHVGDALGLAVDNQGVNGDTLAGMRERLSALLGAGRRWRFATVMGGSNDVALGFRQAAMAEHLAAIVTLLQAAGVPVAVGLPPPIWLDAGLEARLAAWRAHVCAAYRPVIDFTPVFADGDAALLPDGVHPSEEANRRMAAVAIGVLGSPGFSPQP